MVPLCMCVYFTPGDEASKRIIYGNLQAREMPLLLLLLQPTYSSSVHWVVIMKSYIINEFQLGREVDV